MKFIDLFAGCGGLSEGFSQAGWEPIFAVEKLRAPCRSYEANFGCRVWCGEIEEFTKALSAGKIMLPKIDGLIGGPPCQGFSPLGKMSAKAKTHDYHNNINELWRYFLDIVEILHPDIILTENVPEFIKTEQFENYKARAGDLGYQLDCDILQADKFGVPQKRRRAFCLGSRLGPIKLPVPGDERMTVRNAIGHLLLEPDGANWHIGRNPTPTSLERYKVIPPGGNRFDLMRARPDITPKCWLRKKSGTTDVFGRLEWDGVALTIRTEFFKPEKGRYLHPEAHRPITHREAASLQTFPETFVFRGTKLEVARQIGEAVPPVLARAVGLSAYDHVMQSRHCVNIAASVEVAAE